MSTSEIETPNAVAAGSDEPQGASADLSLDTVFEILKNRRRRDILQYLWNHDGSANIGELAEHIAALENEIEVAALSSSQRKRVYIGLYQCHLPKMDDAGIVEFDKHRGTIALREAAAELGPYLTPDSDETTDVSARSLAVALAVGVVVPAGVLGLGPLAAVPALGWALVSTLALLFVAGDQVHTGDDYDLFDSFLALRARLSAGESAS
ncbi:DUF7344 domain-containing protein [Halomarina litorea]|uniref:DUF7344 domain-containing protein n=1 Tax=Halomarina litorea TaxID=2961595 RepID=UPI0020C49F83|nr:hypothetical protein [Halomarina sp. BCD28]